MKHNYSGYDPSCVVKCFYILEYQTVRVRIILDLKLVYSRYFWGFFVRSLVFLAYIPTNCFVKNQAAYNPCSRCEMVTGGSIAILKNNLCRIARGIGQVA